MSERKPRSAKYANWTSGQFQKAIWRELTTRRWMLATLARECGISQATLSNLMQGRSEPSADTLRRLHTYLGMSYDEMLGEHSDGADQPVAE